MRITEIGTPPQKRRLRHWLLCVCVGFLLIGCYAAGIGPLTELEASGYGQRKYWGYLHLIYSPVFWGWKHGPDWWADGLATYVDRCQSPAVCGPNLSCRFVASYHKLKTYRFMKRLLKDHGYRHRTLGEELARYEREMTLIKYRSAKKWCADAGPEHIELGVRYIQQANEEEKEKLPE